MIKTIRERKNANVVCYNEPLQHVQSHLSVTPAEMLQMSERGIPISSHMRDGDFYDGDNQPLVTIDPIYMRGVDINDAWNAQQSAKQKLINAHLKDVEKYGK